MKRNYTKELKWQASPEQKARRAARGRARTKMGLKDGDPGEVEHKDGNPRNNSKSNLKVVSKKFQRTQGGHKTRGRKGTGKKKK